MSSTVAGIFETMAYGPAPESKAPALEWLKAHGGEFGLFVGGQWVAPQTGERFETINPATREVLARVAQADAGDVDRAVRAARAALPAWRGLSGHARARHLYALAREVQKNARLLAVLESLDNGKSIRETRDIDVPLVARHFYHHAGWAQLLETEFPGYGPVGVVGQIIPWNFPLLMVAWKVAPALAAGNTIVLKPAEFTPLTALCFAEIAERAGLPTGVLNVITGDGRTGAALVQHADVDKIAFTGSTDVGRIIRKQTAGSGKSLTLELGGKSPFIVFEDADLDSVVEGVVDAIWFNQGQVCCAGSRLLVQEGVSERLLGKLRARMEKLRLGSPLDKAVDMGAIVAPVQLERIRTLVNQGVDEGAKMWQPSWACPTEGYFYPPTLFTDVSPAATIAQVEIFGPVLVSMTFRTPREAVELANNTPYGLAASVWTENINLALDVAPKLKAGVVWVNCTNQFDAASGFGGYRESGFGREGGREGMWAYLKADWESENAERGTRNDAGAPVPRSDVRVPSSDALPPIDRTPKLFIGGKQVRPDQGYSRQIRSPSGALVGEVGDGNRKDIRNAVEAAQAAAEWGRGAGHTRAQILYYVAENLSARAQEFAGRIQAMTGGTPERAQREVAASIARLFTYAAWADKYDGAVHHVPIRGVTLAMNEPLGVIGIVAPEEQPLLGFTSLVAPAIAMGNTVVVVPSEAHPLSATDFYGVLETSDLPDGVVNIVTGEKDALARVLAEHLDVE
ncbi:MAG TPA: aldehyde dehydrogenase family protein, partial [Gemmatimonadales bacterium]|nr:aldehyde dehydrogenase family protein [Gemmatimonadales bacterium]